MIRDDLICPKEPYLAQYDYRHKVHSNVCNSSKGSCWAEKSDKA